MKFSWRSTTTHGTAATIGGVMVAAATLITPFEGTFTRTYKDPVGIDTVCTGETEKWAVEEGKRRAFTKAECADMLAKSLPKYDAGIKGCTNRPLPQGVRVAMISATYNIGVGGFCHSSMAKRINAGDFRGACDALLAWNKAGHPPRVLKGLDTRRKAERDVCLKGLA